jgi:hypothetical protein
VVALSFSGCSYLFYPKAGHYLTQAKGTTGVQTIENLTTMLEASSKAAFNPTTYQAAMDDLHNQVHALDSAFCEVTEEQAKTVTYAKAVTLKQEIWAIFKRLWKQRHDQSMRVAQLDLFGKRLQELRETVRLL